MVRATDARYNIMLPDGSVGVILYSRTKKVKNAFYQEDDTVRVQYDDSTEDIAYNSIKYPRIFIVKRESEKLIV